ncbi:MAG: prepilin-type N-terminal cleavage/methylation domain-containing protein [bacterium]
MQTTLTTSSTAPTSPKASKAGFTLIELLVVLTIISLLVGILLPSLAKARQSAQRTKCLVNLRSFGIAMEGYRREHKDLIPDARVFGGPALAGNQRKALWEILQPYLDSAAPIRTDPNDPASKYLPKDPYFCPSDKDPEAGVASGSSYEYWGGVVIRAVEVGRNFNPTGGGAPSIQEIERSVQFSTTKFFEANNDFPILGDAQGWHKNVGGAQTGKNALYFGDWRVDWMNFPEENRIQEIQDSLSGAGAAVSPPP